MKTIYNDNKIYINLDEVLFIGKDMDAGNIVVFKNNLIVRPEKDVVEIVKDIKKSYNPPVQTTSLPIGRQQNFFQKLLYCLIPNKLKVEFQNEIFKRELKNENTD